LIYENIPISKKCYKILTLIVIILYIIKGYYFHTNSKKIFPCLVPILSLYILALSWLYMTGIMIVVKSISYFKNKEITLGIGLSIISLLFFIFSFYIVGFLFMFIYPQV
jgi:hypothetical protein